MAKLTLGLDLGSNSIGWALIDDRPDEPEKSRIVDLGVRVFPEGVDNFDSAKEVSRNEGRRIARGMRRQINRRSSRKKALRRALVEASLLPAEPAEQARLDQQLDPYQLRSRALMEKLSPYEIGRLLIHLNQRRGFLSNRKKDRGDKEVEGMLAEINQLAAEMQEDNSATLGQHLNKKLTQLDHANRSENDHVRNRHTNRSMFVDEFEAIWEAQHRLGHHDLLTDELKYGGLGRQTYPCKPLARPKGLTPLEAFGIYGLIFFQRKMYWPKSMIGLCELEPKQPRCPRADRRAQGFRLLQEINNLRYTDPDTHEECKLSRQQRTLLLQKLGSTEKMTFDQIRKALGFLESVKFNLERGKRPQLQGAVVDARMAKAVGKSWYQRPEPEKDEIVRVLLDNERDDEAILQRAVSQWGMTPEQANAALRVEFPSGYIQLSLKAINKLLPHMERGLLYQAESDPEASALHAAGYLRRDELQRRIFDRLPDPRRTRDCPIGDLPNPVVRRTLVEVRKLVNAIIRCHGKPAAVHVEMGRDVKSRPKKGTEAYRKYHEQLNDMREREARRDAAAEKLRENKIPVNRDSVLRYLLWEDQHGECIYSGKPIGFAKLFGGEVHVDHILPYSRCLDDSQENKVVCLRDANADKADRTPYEWLAESNPERYESLCQRAAKLQREGRMRYGKYRRFLQKELKLDEFIARQLNDMRYIARVTGEYLRYLFDADHHVLGLKGQLTAELRWQWGIETLLEELPDSPAWHEQSNLRPGQKNRADHRHHAVDAVVLALTNRARLNQLTRISKAGGVQATGELLLDPWPTFREDLKAALAEINVSHRAERKVSGRLHEETLYGPTDDAGFWVARKPVESLSPNEIERIRDAKIREIVIQRLNECGIQFGRGEKPDAKQWKQALTGLAMPSRVPIKKVRVLKPDQTIRPIREGTPQQAFVKPGATHHLCIFQWEEDGRTRRDAVFLTMLESSNRLKQHQPVIQRTHPQRPEAQFVMSLSRGEMVLANCNGQDKLLVFKTAASTTGQMWFAEHTDSRKSANYKKYTFQVGTLDARKVTVDPLGRIRWAND